MGIVSGKSRSVNWPDFQFMASASNESLEPQPVSKNWWLRTQKNFNFDVIGGLLSLLYYRTNDGKYLIFVKYMYISLCACPFKNFKQGSRKFIRSGLNIILKHLIVPAVQIHKIYVQYGTNILHFLPVITVAIRIEQTNPQ